MDIELVMERVINEFRKILVFGEYEIVKLKHLTSDLISKSGIKFTVWNEESSRFDFFTCTELGIDTHLMVRPEFIGRELAYDVFLSKVNMSKKDLLNKRIEELENEIKELV